MARGTEHGDEEAGVLRIDFPGGTEGDGLVHIDRSDWFMEFEEEKLAFLYQAQKSDGGDSTFFKLIQRD